MAAAAEKRFAESGDYGAAVDEVLAGLERTRTATCETVDAARDK